MQFTFIALASDAKEEHQPQQQSTMGGWIGVYKLLCVWCRLGIAVNVVVAHTKESDA